MSLLSGYTGSGGSTPTIVPTRSFIVNFVPTTERSPPNCSIQ
jgi:hypothetical protein